MTFISKVRFSSFFFACFFSKRIEFYTFCLTVGFLFKSKESSSYLLPDPLIFFLYITKVTIEFLLFALLCDFFFKSKNQVLTFCLTVWFFWKKKGSNSCLLHYNVFLSKRIEILSFALPCYVASFFFNSMEQVLTFCPSLWFFSFKSKNWVLTFYLTMWFFSKGKKSSSYPDCFFISFISKVTSSYRFALLCDFFQKPENQSSFNLLPYRAIFFSKGSSSYLLPYHVIFSKGSVYYLLPYLVIIFFQSKNRILSFCLPWDCFFSKESSSYLSPYLVICFTKVKIEFSNFALPCDFYFKSKNWVLSFLPYYVFFQKELSSIPFALPWDFFFKSKESSSYFCLILWYFIYISKVTNEFLLFALPCDFFQKKKTSSYPVFFFISKVRNKFLPFCLTMWFFFSKARIKF